MPNGNLLRKCATSAALAVIAGAVMLLACDGGRDIDSTSAALNYKGDGGNTGNKPLSFTGYEVKDNSTVNLYLDKRIDTAQVVKDMFSVKLNGGGGTELVSSITSTPGDTNSGVNSANCTGIAKGTRVALTINGGLTADSSYHVVVSKFLTDDNGLSLGNYRPVNGDSPAIGKDLEFDFTAPSCSGGTCTWSGSLGNPTVAYSVDTSGVTNASREPAMLMIFDRPIASGSLSSFKAALNDATTPAYYRGTTPDSDHEVVNIESYPACSNDNGENTSSHNTTFFYPMSRQGSSATPYNLGAGIQYTLDVPSFTGVVGSVNPNSFTFTTMNGDLPGWLEGAPTVSIGTSSSGDLNVSWSATALDPNQVGSLTGYHVYVSDEFTSGSGDLGKKYGHYTYVDSTDNVTTSYTIPSLDCTKYYYVRIVPYNGYGPTGFSLPNATLAHPKC